MGFKYEYTEKKEYEGVIGLEGSTVVIVDELNNTEELIGKIKLDTEIFKVIVVPNEMGKIIEIDNNITEIVEKSTKDTLDKIYGENMRKENFDYKLVGKYLAEGKSMIEDMVIIMAKNIIEGKMSQDLSDLDELGEVIKGGNFEDAETYIRSVMGGMDESDLEIIREFYEEKDVVIVYNGAGNLEEDYAREVAEDTNHKVPNYKLIFAETKETYEKMHCSIKSRCDLLQEGKLYNVEFIQE